MFSVVGSQCSWMKAMTDAGSSGATGDRRLHLSLTAANLCHPGKKSFSGEDAFAIRDDGHCQILAVADGVSGSRTFGDPAEFSRSLLYFLMKSSKLCNDTSDALRDAINAVRSAGKRGSTTVLVGTFDSNDPLPVLHLYNLGDSRSLLFRYRNQLGRYKLFAETLPQYRANETSYSNMPYQLHHNGEKSCSVSDIEVYDWPLQKGDIIVTASDGLTDFLKEQEIQETIENCRSDLHHLASSLANQARHVQDGHGKYDDISVIVAVTEDFVDCPKFQPVAVNNLDSISLP